MECKNCKHWNPVNDQHGQCVKNPPNATLVPAQGLGGQGLTVVSYWPETKPDNRCGSFETGPIFKLPEGTN